MTKRENTLIKELENISKNMDRNNQHTMGYLQCFDDVEGVIKMLDNEDTIKNLKLKDILFFICTNENLLLCKSNKEEPFAPTLGEVKNYEDWYIKNIGVRNQSIIITISSEISK